MRTVRVRGIIRHEDMYLFVQHAPSSQYWALPGGGVEDGEVLTDALSRELIEELGVKPKIGKLLYVQQLFKGEKESLEFFFEVLNGKDFVDADWKHTTYGALELARVEFIDPAKEHILPAFLKDLDADIAQSDWPKISTASWDTL